MDGVKLKFTKGALQAIAKRSAHARKRRPRSARHHGRSHAGLMYDVPSKQGIKEVASTKDAINKGDAPLIVYHKEAGVG